MTDSQHFVIIGAGLAGATAAQALREQGFDGRLTMLGDEAHYPYERPPLSKTYLTGKTGRGELFVHDESWYAEHAVEVRLGDPVTRIRPGGHRIETGDGADIGYDRLLITTGARPRELSVPGAHAQGVHYLRTLDDADTLAATLAAGSRLAVIGAGWIGLETSAAARQAGVEVAVVEAAELPLLRVLGPEVAEVFARLHREHGVDLRLGASLAEIGTRNGRATGVRLHDGTSIGADAVLVGVGVGASPNVELATGARLAVDNGILVDAALRTSDPDIFAAGDVANVRHPGLGRHIRVEHWANALKQPVAVAAAMLGGDAGYDEIPYFYTDQYDLGMEYVGHVEPGGYDRVVFRGDVATREFTAFWLADNRVLAGMNVNIWDAVEPIKALIRRGAVIDPAQLADPEVPLGEFTTAGR
ncbi:MAG: NAD(P)/FAD-dependent oxidoreductase [Jatrophihabitantaceae bacterium]